MEYVSRPGCEHSQLETDLVEETESRRVIPSPMTKSVA